MVGQRIRYYRKVKGLTQEELAQGICSVSYLSKIEKGDAKSSDEVINLLCDRLGISPNETNNDEILEMLDEWNMMMVNKRFDEAGEFQKTVQEKMQGVSDPNILLRYELFKCRCIFVTSDDFDDGYHILENIKNHILQSDNNELLFYYNQFMGMYFSFKYKLQSALKHFKMAEEFHMKADLKEIEAAIVYFQLAITYNQLSRVSAVNFYAYKAITIFDKEYNYNRSADCQIILAIANRRVRNFDQAIYHLDQALKYAKTFKDDNTEGIIYHNLGYIAATKKEHTKAIKFLLKGIELKQHQLLDNVMNTLLLLSKEYFYTNNYDEAKKWINKALSHVEKANDPSFFYHFNIINYQVHNQTTELEDFLRREAIPFFESQDSFEYLANYSEFLADLYFDQSLYKKASQYYRLSNNARKNIF
ncbi:helix-turn-helix domain-containing protein [Fictibacillus iocasae]|uniref:Helix-turn-helix domain-containing protein n=1 Tax=Fictibacillus iocasae TaxID=2715437 RepID=A0ABW2NTU2_9BACL